jgi:hypothetical protein
MKHKKVGLFIPILILSLIINFVSAYSGSYDPRQGMEDLIDLTVDFFEPLLQVILGGENWTGYLLFERLILFILLTTVIYLSLKKANVFGDNTAVLWIVSLAIPLLGIRWINFEWLNTILIQYKVLAIVLTAGLPFVIYFLFLYQVLGNYAILRKIGWIFFAVIFFGLWATADDATYSEVYVWTGIIAILFFLFDGTIRRFMIKSRMQQLGIEKREQYETEILRQISQTQKDLASNIITVEQYNKMIRRLNSQLKALRKN